MLQLAMLYVVLPALISSSSGSKSKRKKTSLSRERARATVGYAICGFACDNVIIKALEEQEEEDFSFVRA